MTQESILNVAINVPLSRTFDYLPPSASAVPPLGTRVRVPFGQRQVVGLVLGHAGSSDLPRAKLKRAREVLDDTPLVSGDDLWLIRFTSDYYHHPIGEVAAAALPALLRKGAALHPVYDVVVARDRASVDDVDALGKRAPKQAELLAAVLAAGAAGIDTDTLTERLPSWRRTYRALADKGLLDIVQRTGAGASAADKPQPTPGPELNDAQRLAVAAIKQAHGFAAFVLDGVTGSGKTEVYLQRIEAVLATGKQVLVLVPEIGLTPQLVARFERRLGFTPALLHSGLTDLQRLESWRRARAGAARLIVGTRSAVFVPLPEAGLIVVDEEHDPSFKQQEGLRYSARDLAIARAKHADIPIVLGSATPTLEMLRHCREGHYAHLELPERAGQAAPPTLRIVDVSRELVDDGLGSVLVGAIESHLAGGNQVLLFLNRRGFAPTLICLTCGHVAECRRCDSRMTVHAGAKRLRCHHCGDQRPLDERCSDCGSDVRPLGTGTERLEDALSARFPDRAVTRIDSDSTQRRGAIDDALESARVGDAEILVGTQMLSKGHHFPKLTLVGVINADQGLFGTEFRSDERLAQSIIQVAGRAGREQTRGEVLIQTAFPSHPFWHRLVEAGYGGVANDALEERAASRWPPYARLALIRAAAHRRGDAYAFLSAARRVVEDAGVQAVRALGPVDAVMARKAGRYRAQLLLQSADRRALHSVLGRLRPELEASPVSRKVRWSIDVDPIELF